ncbi:MAG: site-2 protease family protein [Thaumarchaeota archaeon]|nr:site-2 protease family protein [Candidatus Terraquivivens yellowstonensis]MCL7392497.1 site-2 protease family protein [Candidatus Terraquivivens yellowstonensis]MCL7398218.1 site-2 protease family protein [Candidatus Terraquivivens yellowstonensis]MCL7399727.1 site-2 protease family protein [Candidatus Terraquivivens yellowstonensis]MCL7401110.1 site-2 protease family protein [Candidatus Terraquivivens yellowstonensis]
MSNERQKAFEFKFPFIILRSRRVTGLFTKTAGRRILGPLGWFMVALLPIASAIGIFLIVNAVSTILISPEVREAGRQMGAQAYLLIPGINPYLPIAYGWIGIVVAIIVHEFSHGILASRLGFKVKSSGILLLLGIPVGAFVEVDEQQLKEASLRNSARVLAAGPGANITVAVACLLALLVLVSGLSPSLDGLYVSKVEEGMPAQQAGISEGDVIVSVNGVQALTVDVLKQALDKPPPDGMLVLEIRRGEGWRDSLTIRLAPVETPEGPRIGVRVVELKTTSILENYKRLAYSSPILHFVPPTLGGAQGFIPFSDTLHVFYQHPIGPSYYYLANLLFWLWFVNVNVGIFNSLPIYPLDGGQVLMNGLRAFAKGRLTESAIRGITGAISVALAMLVISMVLLPFLIK